jgi:hypothetical protein
LLSAAAIRRATLPAGTRLTPFSDDKPDRFFTVIKFWLDETSGFALALESGVPTSEVEDRARPNSFTEQQETMQLTIANDKRRARTKLEDPRLGLDRMLQIVFSASCNCPKMQLAPNNATKVPITVAKTLGVGRATPK